MGMGSVICNMKPEVGDIWYSLKHSCYFLLVGEETTTAGNYKRFVCFKLDSGTSSKAFEQYFIRYCEKVA